MANYRSNNSSLFAGIDWGAVACYAAIVLFGWVAITAASYDEEIGPMFSFAHFYIKQAVWICVAAVGAIFVLLLDERYYHMWAYPIYIGALLLLAGTLVLGTEINGAKAWYRFGSIALQPVEFVKIATALAMARMMSEYHFAINTPRGLMRAALLLLFPMGIILAQNDTGSALVFGAFLFMLYREGLHQWFCIPLLMMVALFIGSFVLSPMLLLVLLVLIYIFSEAMMSGEFRTRIIFLAAMGLSSIILFGVVNLLFPDTLSYYGSLLITTVVAAIGAVIYAIRYRIGSIVITVFLFLGSMLFLQTTEYFFDSVLQEHQRDRLMTLFGIVNDPLGTDYNVIQAKIAIGSGGFTGKGFLQNTQIKHGFVPEGHTDFIFCTVGEEWGLIGTVLLLGLMCMLILRLMRMGERQEEPFGRIYCYCVASILLFHTFVNVGMLIGLMPVMGIPLPFVSYGGSSLIAFTIMLFIAIRLDASTRQFSFSKL